MTRTSDRANAKNAKRATSPASKSLASKSSTRKNAATSSASARDALLDALRESLGVAYFACKRANVDYEQYLQWRRDDLEFARKVASIEELALDFVEGKALEAIRDGNARLIQFYLQTKGRSRGYAPKEEDAPSQTVAFLTQEEMEF